MQMSFLRRISKPKVGGRVLKMLRVKIKNQYKVTKM